jgi:hypothetical protein
MSEIFGDPSEWKRSAGKPYEAPSSVTPKAAAPPRRVKVSAESKPAKPNRHIGRKLGAVGLVTAVALSAGVYGKGKLDDRNAKLRDFQAVENTLLNSAVRTPLTLSENVIVLGAGVEEHSTPADLRPGKHNWFNILPGNVIDTIGAGKEQLVAKGVVYVDKHNTTWLGYTHQDGSVVRDLVSADEVAQDMVWVNASQLTPAEAKIAPRKSGELVDFSVPTLDAHVDKAPLNVNGQFLSATHNPIAWAPPAEPAGSYAAAHRADMA